MPFATALTSDDYIQIRGTGLASPSYRASEYAAFLPNTVIFQAKVNGAPSGTSYAQVPFDTVSVGAYTAILADQVVIIGADSDIRNATFTGRARADNSGVVAISTVLNINETSTPLPDNANIWVILDWRINDRLARQVGTTQYKDYALTYHTPPPFIYNLQSVYAGVCIGSNPTTHSFAPLAQAITSGATISSWHWTVPSGMTITSGSSTTQNITATFDSGFSQFVTVTATDSNGKVGIFHFWVLSVASDYSNVVNLDTSGASLSCDNGNWSGSLTGFAGVSALLDNTLACIFDVEWYNGTQDSPFANVKFLGRIRVERDTTTPDIVYGLLKKTDFDLEGVLDQLGREEHLPFALVTKASPTKFDELTNLTIPRAIAYTLYWHTTLLTLHALSFDSFDNTWLYPLLPTQGGNMQGVINDLATSINANLQAAPTGELQIVRNADYLSNTQRSSLVTVANFTTTDFIDLQPLTVTEVDETGKVQASGGFYNSTSGTVTPLLSLAPGAAQGIGAGVNNFTRQVLIANQTQTSAQSELNTRTGNQYAIVQRKQPEMQINFPPGYNWLVPSVNQWYTFTIPADFNTGGRVFTTSDRWLLMSVNITHDNAVGSKAVQAVFQLESQGAPGQTVIYPAPGTIIPSLPVLPVTSPYPSMPPLPDITLPPTPTPEDSPPYSTPIPKGDGSVVAICSNFGVWVGTNFIATSHPAWNEITPPFSYVIMGLAWQGAGMFVLMVDTINHQSYVAYTPDATNTTPTWTLGEVVEGEYQTIRTTSTAGEVYLAGVTATTSAGCDLSGWIVTLGTEISRDDSTIVIDSVNVDGSKVIEIKSAGDDDCCVFHTYSQTGGGSPVFQWDLCGESYPGDFPHDLIHSGGSLGGSCVNAVLVFGFLGGDIGQVTINFTNTDPDCGESTSYTSRVAYSSDYGATFATPSVISPSLSPYMGFDTEKVGIPTLAGQAGQVEIATSAGGAYGDYGDPFPTGAGAFALWIPRYQFGSITTGNINDSTPEYLAGSAVLTAGNESIWKVTASGVTFTSITPNVGGDYGLVVSPDCLTMAYKSGRRLAAILLFDTTHYLMVSGTTGAAWTQRAAMGTDAAYVRFRKTDLTFQQLFIADGDVKYSGNFGATVLTKTSPTTDPIICIEPFSI